MSDRLFETHFGTAPTITRAAHGRVNLIGEHTDYCGGYVMPTLISQRLIVEIAAREDSLIAGISSEFGEEQAEITAIKDGSWLLFVKGALALMNEKGSNLSGLNIAATSTIPVGAGVSSSAAFEIALLRALSEMTSIPLSAQEMAIMGQRIEHEFIGTKCGIMDQMAVAIAEIGQALFLDCHRFETEIITIPEDWTVAIIHSGSSRKLSASLYNERLAETIEAAKQMGHESLRDASISDLAKVNDEILIKRSHHIISENQRVLTAKAALKAGDAVALGLAMTQSHISLRDDYEVSSEALDHLVSTAIAQGAFGARLTGAGFGGCIVALLQKGSADEVIEAIIETCENSWLVDCL